MKISKISCVLLAGLLAACGSDNNSDSPTPAASTSLISDVRCDNTITKSAGHYSSDAHFGTIATNGLAIFGDIDDSGDKIYAGCLKETGNTLSGRLNLYDSEQGSKVASGTLTATIDTTVPDEPSISGTLTVGSDVFTFAERYNRALSRQAASTSLLASAYDDGSTTTTPKITATVSSDNAFTLKDDNVNCTFKAPISVPDSNLNLYLLTRFTITCGTTITENAATGFAVRIGDYLYVGFTNNLYTNLYFLQSAAL